MFSGSTTTIIVAVIVVFILITMITVISFFTILYFKKKKRVEPEPKNEYDIVASLHTSLQTAESNKEAVYTSTIIPEENVAYRITNQ